MRGRQPVQPSLVCLVNLEDRIPKDHPLRAIKARSDAALKALSRTFDRMYSKKGRPSVPPERLLKGMLLMALYSIRSEVRLCEELEYNFLYRWFLDMDMVEQPFDHCAFSDNRDRLLRHKVAVKFLEQTWRQAEEAGLLSPDHFSVDGTLIEAWASMKSFRPKDDDDSDNNGWSDFKGGKRSNDTHESKTDPEAKLFRKGRGKEAKLAFMGHVLMENRNGLIRDLRVTLATGRAERDAARKMLQGLPPRSSRRTVGADAGYNTKDFVAQCRDAGFVPHVAGKQHSAVDARTTGHATYDASQKCRKRIESIFGWMKTAGGLRKTRLRGVTATELWAQITGAAYNLLRMVRLTEALA